MTMRPKYVTVAASGKSAWIPLDRHAAGYALAVNVPDTSTLTYSVQHTFDDVFTSANAGENALVFEHDDTILTSQSSSQSSNFVLPPTAVRLFVSAYTDGSAILQIIPMENSA